MSDDLIIRISGAAELIDAVEVDTSGPISETERTTLFIRLFQDGALDSQWIDLDETDGTGKPKHFPLLIGDASLQSIEDVERHLGEIIIDYVDWDAEVEKQIKPTPFKWQSTDNVFVRTQLQRMQVPGPVAIPVVSAAAADMALHDFIDLVDEAGNPVILLDDAGRHLPVKVIDVVNDKMYESVPAFTIGISHDEYPIEFLHGAASNFGIMWRHFPDGTRKQVCYRGAYGRDLHVSPRQLVIKIEP